MQTISISSLNNVQNFNVDEQLVLTGTIYSYRDCITVWTVVNISSVYFASFNLKSGIQKVSAFQWKTINLVIMPSALSSSNFYTFNLQCNSLKSSFDVVPNKPPRNGYFRVLPPSGVEVSTIFHFLAGQWVDKDLPLTYQFSYIENTVQVIGIQSERNFTFSPLPSSSTGAKNLINCSVEVFDSISASTISFQDVRVHPAQREVVNRYLNSTIHTARTSSLLLNEVNLISSLLSKINCSNAPNCYSLHRSECSSVDHTCGDCLPQFIGESGSHNTYCFDRLAATTNANITTQFQAKECLNNCSSNGRCYFVDSNSLQRVPVCPIVSTSCEAICECVVGYGGTFCAFTLAELQQKISIRNVLFSNVKNISQHVQSASAVVAVVSSLSSLTTAPDELSPTSAAIAISTVKSLLSSAQQFQVGYQDVLELLLQTVDNAARAWNTTTGKPYDVLDALKQIGSLVSHQMYPDQSSVASVHTNFRLSLNTLVSPNISVPLSPLEMLARKISTELNVSSLLSDNYGIVQATRIILIEAQSIHFPNQSSFKSNPVIVTVTVPSNTLESHNITISFANTIPNSLHQSDYNFSTICHKRANNSLHLVRRYFCPISGFVVVHNCTNRVGVLTTVCPKYQPSCSNITDLNHRICEVASFTEHKTVCNCCIAKGISTTRRKLDSSDKNDVAESTTLQVVATGGYLVDEVAETFSAAPRLSSPGDLQKVVIVISIFGSLWALGFVLLAGLLGKKKSQSDPKAKGIRRGAILSSKDIRAALDDYISEIIPAVFRGSSLWVESIVEVFAHHKYAIILYSDSVILLALGKIITALSTQIFLLAATYDLQSPSDDGTCVQWQVEEDCLARKSYLDSSQTFCQWAITSDDGWGSLSSEYSCSYRVPSTTVQEFLAILVIVSIITALFLRPIDFLFGILDAPSPTVIPIEFVKIRDKMAYLKRRAAFGVAGMSVKDISESIITARNAARKSICKQLNRASSDIKERKVVVSERRATIISLGDATSGLKYQEIPVLGESYSKEIFTQDFIVSIACQRRLLSTKTLSDFDSQWGIRKVDLGLSEVNFKTGVFDKIFDEVEHVRRTALAKISELKLVSEEQTGLELLHLFLKDLLGRDSPAAKIFDSKLEEDFEATRVVTYSRKVIAGIILVLLNVLFFYYTMLYGAVKGEAWQSIFLDACIAQFFIEIFINETLECVWLNYLVPLLASREVRAAHKVLMNLVDKICSNDSQLAFRNSDCLINAPDYLFVSTNVSKSFPSLMESTIVQSYNSYFPGEIAKRWQRTRLQHFTDHFRILSGRKNGALRFIILAVSISLSLLEMCATAPYLLQRMFVRLIQPVFIAGIILAYYIIVASPVYIATFFLSALILMIFIFRRSLLQTVGSFKVSPMLVPRELVDESKIDSGFEDISSYNPSSEKEKSSNSSDLSFNISFQSCLSSNVTTESKEQSSGARSGNYYDDVSRHLIDDSDSDGSSFDSVPTSSQD